MARRSNSDRGITDAGCRYARGGAIHAANFAGRDARWGCHLFSWAKSTDADRRAVRFAASRYPDPSNSF